MFKLLEKVATGQQKDFLTKIIQIMLWPVSLIYRFGIFCDRKSYDFNFKICHVLPKPVISVGNITWGGVGKTPCVGYLVNIFLSRGLKPVILTRGYKTSADQNIKSDEARMLQSKFPGVDVLIGKNRSLNALEYLKKTNPDVFILDDGFQHWPLKRDLDIVLINALNPWGNGSLIPCGMLREPLFALKRASVIVLTKTNLVKDSVLSLRMKIQAINPGVLIVEANHLADHLIDGLTNEKRKCEILESRNVFLCSSIADPGSFRLLINTLNVKIADHEIFTDHYEYLVSDVKNIIEKSLLDKASAIVTTEKDWVKLEMFKDLFKGQIDVFVLSMQFDIVSGKEKLVERIDSILFR